MDPIPLYHGYTDHKPSHAWLVWLFVGSICVLFCWYLFSAPRTFRTDSYIKITSGESATTLAHELASTGYVRNEKLTYYLFRTIGRNRIIHVGDYYMAHAYSSPVLVFRIVFGLDGAAKIKITIPEGSTRAEISALLAPNMPLFSEADFMHETKEGYVFPDTYYVTRNTTTEEFVAMANAIFDTRTQTILRESNTQHLSMNDVIIFASLLEKEAAGDTDRATIAGILWNRLHKDMPLQVDATFLYTIGKSSQQLTISDLKSTSPYNTYTHTGLPPTPINNPGRATLLAVLHPLQTPYLFYLHDKNGMVHYAQTYAEQLHNEALYLH